jgi:hypothetical protein
MSEALIIGLITDTSSPAQAARLLGDIGALAAADPGLSRVEVIVFENPSGEPAPRVDHDLTAGDLPVHRVRRGSRERRAASEGSGEAELQEGRLPIAAARTIVQRHAFERAAQGDAAVWILDEDLRLTPLLDEMGRGEPPLSARVRRLRAARVDVALGPVLGAPPLPARSTLRVNLEDVRRHLDVIASLDPEAAWPDLAAENARVRRALSEYYYDLSRAHEDAGAHPMWLERAGHGETVRAAFARLASAVGGLLDGIPITRSISSDQQTFGGEPTLTRGGNTLVLRPALLASIPNVAPRIAGRVSRRSDMLWARLAAALEGARFARAPLPALQDRSGAGCSIVNTGKLLDDVRGSAVVAALDALIGEGELAPRRRPCREAVRRAAAVYVDRARERLAAIESSEERVRALLDRIASRVRAPDGDAALLSHPKHAHSIERLLDNLARLREALGAPFAPIDPALEQPDVEKFLLDLPEELSIYRAGACVCRGEAQQSAPRRNA